MRIDLREQWKIFKFRLFKIAFLIFRSIYLYLIQRHKHFLKIEPPKKILFVRIGPIGIGDMVLSLPAIVSLKKSFPKAKLYILLLYIHLLLLNIAKK